MSNSVMAWLSLIVTFAMYFAAKVLYRRWRAPWAAPIVLAPLCVIMFVISFKIPLQDYFQYTHLLVLMLGPATIAFALPIYRQRHMLKRYPLTLLAGVLTGLSLGLISSWALGHLLHLPPVFEHSLMTRSVSTPFAMTASVSFGGVPDITAMLVLLTGIIGMLIGEPLFRLLRVRSSWARGASLGGAAHGAGTAKAQELGAEEGVVASLTMIFSGVSMVLLAPYFALLFN